MTAAQCRAARVLIHWSSDALAQAAGLEAQSIEAFETGAHPLDPVTVQRLQSALEQGGAVFIEEDERAGAGVRLKFNRGDVRAIRRLEGEGGRTGEDDVC
jgi:transcriptional regulator with XRE-family HTH domain